MKNTNPIFSLKNFRSFGNENADFELAPITVLTGCNSAGKSSLVKALLLLSSQPNNEGTKEVIRSRAFYENEDYDFDRYGAGTDVIKNSPSKVLKISSKELGLGRYDKVLHHNAKDGMITIKYRMWSKYLHEEVIVKRLFQASNDVLNEGELTELTIEKLDGTIIYKYFWNDKTIHVYVENMGEVSYTTGWDEVDGMNTVIENYKKYSDICDYYSWKESNEYFQKNKDNSIVQRVLRRIEEEYPQAIEESAARNSRMEELKKQLGEEIDDYRDIVLKGSTDQEFGLSSAIDCLRKIKRREVDMEFDSEHKKEIAERSKNNFYINVVNECLSPSFITNISYIDSSSAAVKRLYSIEDDNKMSVALSKLVNRQTSESVNKWLKKFEIADGIEVVGTDEGIGIMVYLIKGNEKCLLADEGYGITQLVSLFLQIGSAIYENARGHSYMDPETFEEIYDTYHLHSFIAIEEPEVHLHPKYQSLLADMFVEAYQKYNIHFIIETHSEYLIRKLQVLVADKENELTPNDVSLNYVDKDENGISTNRKIYIREDGSLDGTFGKGFYDEADSLAMELFRRKPILS